MGSYSGGAGRSFFEYISQVVVYPAGFLVVGELDIKHFDEAVTQVGGENGGDGFDAAVEVTTHPVGGAHEDFGFAVVAEVPDTGVFEETASLLTPTIRSKTASTKRKMIMHK